MGCGCGKRPRGDARTLAATSTESTTPTTRVGDRTPVRGVTSAGIPDSVARSLDAAIRNSRS